MQMSALPNATMYSLHMCTDPFSYNNKNPNSTTSSLHANRKQADDEGASKKSNGEKCSKKEKDILDWLLQAGLGPVVTEILLLLDPPSLHAAKQVNFSNQKIGIILLQISGVSVQIFVTECSTN